MKRIPLPNRALALPLVGLIFTWALFMFGQWVSMASAEQYNNGPNPSVYVYLAALAVAALSSMVAQGWAVQAHSTADGEGLERAAHRFTNLTVVLSLAALTIFVIGNFIGSFNSSNERNTLLDNLVWLYLPIILATALVVLVILRAFVFQHDTSEKGEGKPKMSEQQKALALGYAIPILTTAFAIILGLAVYQTTRTNLQIWVWVIIIAIVGYGVVMGTRFAAKAKSAKPAVPKPRTALTAGAANLNFVLSVVFGGVVSIMAFAFGGEAIGKLQTWPTYSDPSQNGPVYPHVDSPTWKWFFEELAPAKVLLLLAVVGVYLSITERHRRRTASDRETGV